MSRQRRSRWKESVRMVKQEEVAAQARVDQLYHTKTKTTTKTSNYCARPRSKGAEADNPLDYSNRSDLIKACLEGFYLGFPFLFLQVSNHAHLTILRHLPFQLPVTPPSSVTRGPRAPPFKIPKATTPQALLSYGSRSPPSLKLLHSSHH